MFTIQGLAAYSAGRPRESVLWFANAAHAAANDPVRRQAALVRVDTFTTAAVRPLTASGGNGDGVRRLFFDSGGLYLVVLTTSGKLLLHEPATGTVLELPDPPSGVRCVALNPAADRLALGTQEGRLQVRSFPRQFLFHRPVNFWPLVLANCSCWTSKQASFPVRQWNFPHG
jgi:hypothetical protein